MSPDKDDDDTNNPKVHANQFPFIGPFQGAGWNCQSLFAYGREDTQKYVLELACKHDFMGLFETRETEERHAAIGSAFFADHEYFHSDLDQFKGGIGLLVKKVFLQKFLPVNGETDWIVIEAGRNGCLKLRGSAGLLHIFVCYFDPEIESIKRLSRALDADAHTIVLGDHFVRSAEDHYVKASVEWSMGDSTPVDNAWRQQITTKGMRETGITLSRIDWVYSSLHGVHSLMGEITCNALDRRAGLSAHRPISFQLRSQVSQANKFHRLPAWICQHESLGKKCSPSSSSTCDGLLRILFCVFKCSKML